MAGGIGNLRPYLRPRNPILPLTKRLHKYLAGYPPVRQETHPQKRPNHRLDTTWGPVYARRHRETMLTLPRLQAIAGLLLSVLLCGCSSILKPVRKVSHLSGEVSIDVTIDADANQNTPVAVDILAVTDAKTLKDISAMSAQAWFQKRANYVRLHPSQLHVYSWEWVPGQEVAPLKIPQAALASGIILFAAYASPGEHSSVLPKSGVVRIELGPKDFKILPGRA